MARTGQIGGDREMVNLYARKYLESQISDMQGHLAALGGGEPVRRGRKPNGQAAPVNGGAPAKKKRRHMSAEARENISKATKARWAKQREEEAAKAAQKEAKQKEKTEAKEAAAPPAEAAAPKRKPGRPRKKPSK